MLNDIAGLYLASDEEAFAAKIKVLDGKFAQLERQLGDGPYFSGKAFSLVDAVFGPVFRYFDAFDRIGDFGVLTDKPRVATWRRALAARPSIRDAVTADYGDRLLAFLEARQSFLAARMAFGGDPALNDVKR